MTDNALISATEAHKHCNSGQALLVCAYESDEKFRAYPLEGASSLSDFESRLGSVAKDQEIIFYCN